MVEPSSPEACRSAEHGGDGLRLLIVEDEVLVAMALEDVLSDIGHTIVGPAMHMNEAIRLAREETIDGAILDVNIAGERVFPVAEILEARGIPFVFTTGYGAAGLEAPFRSHQVLQKPYAKEHLIKATEEWIRH